MSGLWCSALGFSHARVIEAGVRALRTLPYYHTFNHRSNPAAIELAQALLALAPVPMSVVFFANSGSEANDSAVSWSGTTTTRAAARPRRRSSRAGAPTTA